MEDLLALQLRARVVCKCRVQATAGDAQDGAVSGGQWQQQADSWWVRRRLQLKAPVALDGAAAEEAQR